MDLRLWISQIEFVNVIKSLIADLPRKRPDLTAACHHQRTHSYQPLVCSSSSGPSALHFNHRCRCRRAHHHLLHHFYINVVMSLDSSWSTPLWRRQSVRNNVTSSDNIQISQTYCTKVRKNNATYELKGPRYKLGINNKDEARFAGLKNLPCRRRLRANGLCFVLFCSNAHYFVAVSVFVPPRPPPWVNGTRGEEEASIFHSARKWRLSSS